MTIASIDTIRSHFPALERIHNGHPVAYFDGPGGTQVPRVVAEAMSEYLFHHNANTHWFYPTSEETDAIIERSREAVADLLNAAPAEVIFGANMTTLTYRLAYALAEAFCLPFQHVPRRKRDRRTINGLPGSAGQNHQEPQDWLMLADAKYFATQCS